MRGAIKRTASIAMICAVFMSFMPFLNGDYAFAKAPSKPGKIASVKVKAGSKSAKISWSKAKGAKKYQVRIMLGKKKVKAVTVKKKAVTIKKLKKNKKYTVYVRGINGKNKGKWKKKSFKTGKSKTGQPTVYPEKPVNNTPVTPHNPGGDNGENYEDNEESYEEKRITIGDIEDMKVSGAIDAGYNDYGAAQYIYGKFSDDKVTDEDSAVALMETARALVGSSFYAYDCDVEASSTDLNSNVYKFSPYYDGIPVVGSSVILEAGKDGTVEGLYNTYDGRLDNVDTWEEIEIYEAEAIAAEDLLRREPLLSKYISVEKDEYGDIIDYDYDEDIISFDSRLVIYCTGGDNDPFLAYEVKIQSSVSADEEFDAEPGVESLDETIPSSSDSGSPAEITADGPISSLNYTYYIYAAGEDCGDIYYADEGKREELFWKNVEMNAVDGRGVSRKINAQKKDNEYRLADNTRNIYTYRAKNVKDEIDYYYLPGDMEQGTSLRKDAVSAHANMEKVYDYYKSIGRNSFDGRGAKIKVSYAFANDKPEGYKNAFWDGRQMVFGTKGNYQNAVDVAGHEFTHAIIDRTAKLIYEGESGALNESYADILGQLVEGKGGNDGWALGEDSDGAIRNMKNPEYYGDPNHYYDYVVMPLDDSNDHGGVHTNSSIFNHAAYLMMTSSDTSNVDRFRWGKLFINALDRMSEKTKFVGARDAIVSTAKKMNFSAKEIAAIEKAFDDVGIRTPSRIRISMRWGAQPEDIDLHIVGPQTSGSSRFHVYYSDLQYRDENGRLAADLDHDDTDSYGPEVATIRKLTPGYYYVFVHDYTNRDSSGSTALSESGATISIYDGDSNVPERTFNIPRGRSGKYWDVCRITIKDDGTHLISTLNTFSEEEPES